MANGQIKKNYSRPENSDFDDDKTSLIDDMMGTSSKMIKM